MPLRPHLRPRPVFLIALAVIAGYGALAGWQRATRPGGRWVGRTHCSWRGDPRVELRPGLARVESIATVAHESVHVAECRDLGPIRYRWSTLFDASNLALEIPAYCAAARVRLRNGWSVNTTRATVLEDVHAATGLDSSSLLHEVVKGCPELR